MAKETVRTAITDGEWNNKLLSVVQSTSDPTKYGLVICNPDGTPISWWGGWITEVVAGTNISVDNTDPAKPIVNSLSDRYRTTSTTSQTIVSTWSLTFTVGANLAYIPQQDVIIVYDSSNHMHGTVTSYSGTTMVVDITHKTGSGTYNSWVINLDGVPIPATGWSLTGNSGTTAGTNFIGTTDAQDLVFKRDSAEVFRLKSTALELATGKITRASSSGIELRRTDDTGSWTSYGTMQFTTDDFITFNKGIRTGTGIYGNSNFSTNSVSLNLGYGYSVIKTPWAWTGSVELEIKATAAAQQPLFRVTNNTTTIFQVSQNNNVQIKTTTDSWFWLDVNGTGIFRSTGTATIPLTVRGFSGQTADLQQWQDSAGTSLLSVSSGGTLKSFQSTGAKDLINHTRSDGMTVRLYTTNGYDVWLQPGNGGDMKLGNSGSGGLSHATTLYGWELYYTQAFRSRSRIQIVQDSGERYGASTESDFEVQNIIHTIAGSAATLAYCSGSIFRGSTIRGYTELQTITDASTVRIDQAPTASTNATFTNAWALHIASGGSRFGGSLVANNITAPSTSVTDTFAMYANDITAGNSAPHFRTENGDVVKLYKNSAVTTVQGIADALTNLWVLASSTIVDIPQNSQSAAYTLVLADWGKHIYHPSADTTARTWTIPANSSVAYPVGTAITFVNDTSAWAITIAITTDTLVLAWAGTTGSRTLAANWVATAIKIGTTRWMISGTNLT